MSYKLIIFDLDGTVVDQNLEIDSKDLRVIHAIQSQNIIVTIATGRILKAAAPFIEKLQVNHPVILYNGAVILDPRSTEVLWEKRITREKADFVLELAQSHNLNPLLYLKPSDDRFYVSEITSAIERFMAKDGITCWVVDNLCDFLTEDPIKIMIISNREKLNRFREELETKVGGLSVVFSEVNYLEILPPGISKGSGLIKLCELLEVPMSEVVAFGDNMNDAEMIEEAGLGVAMGTGPQALKAKADFVTSSVDEGGIREILYEIFPSL